MQKSETETIDGLEVKVTQLPALRAFNLLARLGKMLAPLIKAGSKMSLDDDVSKLAPVIGEALSQLDDQGASDLAIQILASTSVIQDGKIKPLNQPELIDSVFTGRMQTMLKTLAFTLKVNFADFFDQASASEATGAKESQ